MYTGKVFSVVSKGLNCFVLLMAAFPAASRAQFEPANPVTLIVRVYIGSFQNPAPSNLTVQITDWYGGDAAGREKQTKAEELSFTRLQRPIEFASSAQESKSTATWWRLKPWRLARPSMPS